MSTHLIIKLILIIFILCGIMCEDVSYDINDKSGDFVMTSEFKATFTSTASMIPYKDIAIKKITDHKITLWETNSPKESCTYIVILKFEELTMLILKINTPEGYNKLHMIKNEITSNNTNINNTNKINNINNNVWIKMRELEFKDLLDEMKLKVPRDNQILIDISNPNKEKVTVRRRNTGGADFITFTTNFPYNLIKIVQGPEVIWRAPMNQDNCADCVVYLRNDEFELLQAFVCTSDFVGFKFFTKLNNRWDSIGETDFYKRLNLLDLQQDNQRRLLEDCNHKCNQISL